MSMEAWITPTQLGIHTGGIQGIKTSAHGFVRSVPFDFQQEKKSSSEGTSVIDRKNIHPGSAERLQRSDECPRVIGKMHEQGGLIVSGGCIERGCQYQIAFRSNGLLISQNNLGTDKNPPSV